MERVRAAIKILRDGHISILDFMLKIIDLSEPDFAYNRDRIYNCSRQEKTSVDVGKCPEGKFGNMFDYLFADSRGRTCMMEWFRPHAISSDTHPWLVLVPALSCRWLTSRRSSLSPSMTIHGIVPAPEQTKLSILLHLYVLAWALLVYATSVLTLGGTYFITGWNAVILLACVEGMTSARGYDVSVLFPRFLLNVH